MSGAGAAPVLIVGEALIDLTRRAGDDEVARPGGSPLNVAVGLSRLDVPVTFASQLGDDERGELLRDHLDASDVDVRSLPPHHGDTSTAIADIGADGHATYAFDVTWNPSELPDAAAFDLVHVGSIGAALAPGADAVLTLAAAAASHQVAVSFDPNVRLGITADADDVVRRFDAIARLATLCRLSDEDATVLRPGVAPEVLLSELCASGVALAMMTFGSQGALLVSGDAQVQLASKPTELADTIGAGDSFTAAVLAGLCVRGWLGRHRFDVADLRWLGELGTTAAAIVCSRPGADPPWLTELPLLQA